MRLTVRDSKRVGHAFNEQHGRLAFLRRDKKHVTRFQRPYPFHLVTISPGATMFRTVLYLLSFLRLFSNDASRVLAGLRRESGPDLPDSDTSLLIQLFILI